MRLHRLEVEAFGPFAERVAVDLDAVAAGGLFLVHGATGSGKTSLLDAVCFALYGDVPGARRKQGLRSDHAGPDATPEVVLELTVGGRRLRITRSPAWDRPKRRGTGTTPQQATVRLEERDGTTWRAVSTRNDEVADVVLEVLGMGMRQFAGVVLLPQGEFATFLRADPEDRRELLEKLFDIEVFADVERWLAEARRDGADALDGARTGLDTDLLRLDDALAQVPGLGEVTDDGSGAGEPLPGTPVDLLPARLAALDARLQHLLTESLTVVDRAESVESGAQAALTRAREVAGHRARGREATERLETLTGQADEHLARREELAKAERAATVSGHLLGRTRAETDVEAATRRAQERRVPLAPLLTASGAASAPDLLGAVSALDAVAEALAREAAPVRDLAVALERAVEQRDAAAARRDVLAHSLPEHVDAVAAAEAQATRLRAESARLGALETGSAVRRDRLRVLDDVDRDRARVLELTPLLLAAGDERLARQADLADLQQRRLDEMAAELARGLTDGDPCPVCGALEHPGPAVAADPVTPEALDAARTALRSAEAAYAGLDRQVGDLRAAVATRSADLGEAGRETLTREVAAAEAEVAAARGATAALPAAERTLEERRATAAEAVSAHERTLAAVEQLDERVAQLSTEAEGARERLVAAVEAHAACPCGADDPGGHGRTREALVLLVRAEEDAAEARGRLAAAEHDLDAALDVAGFASADEARTATRRTADLDRLRDAVLAHDRGLDAARAVLAEPAVGEALAADPPDLDALAAAAAHARRESFAARSASDAVGRAARSLAGLRPALEQRCADLGAAADHHARVKDLADAVGGTGGDNTLKMRLTSYVLASRLDTVARLANERLAVMGAGRYVLEHSDELAARGRRSGLGLKVLDQWTGRVRDTASLSGGESFMASLALALGLADAVRAEAGGHDLGTLFVDEGFGTLDDESLEQVLSVLDGLREGGRAVGVVSHVADLRARVPHQVVVTKGTAGSTVSTRTEADAPAA
ncbi:AAA family ATPase [Phycicoccus flavus]|uniref:AAA family ATPase n=1 Tax=Phycicoccus flavus TaxID=2502783 RepID=UPI000FEC0B79|nr:SMC family ATPase [Phycicoccus flavus]NHA70005.1 SMC family ATPase [Phycicoccus flavus]